MKSTHNEQGGSVFRWSIQLLALVILSLSGGSLEGRDKKPVVQYPDAEFKKLDTFEAHSLNKADKLFAKQVWKQGAAAYEAFLQEFPNSKATPYVILQKGRCLQYGNKRNAAVRVYTEVLDYFPNRVPFAGPAIFFIGESYWQNGDIDKALRAWTKMAKDKGYRKHFLAAGALNKLAGQLLKRGDKQEGLKFYRQVAVDFRGSNHDQARHAMGCAIALYIRKLAEPDLSVFYKDVKGFERNPMKIKGDHRKEGRYWWHVVQAIKRHGTFGKEQSQLRDAYYRYWAKTMSGRFASWDDYQIDLAAFHRVYERDDAKWAERLDRQFQGQGKQDDAARILKWIGLFAGRNKAKADEYFGKLDLNKTPNKTLIGLMNLFFRTKGRETQAKNVFRHIRLKKLSDRDKYHLARSLWRRSGGLVRDVCMSFKVIRDGQSLLLDYYLEKADAKNGLPIADELAGDAKYANHALYRKAQLLQKVKRHKEAISTYQQCDCAPKSLFYIAECFEAMGNRKGAVMQLREIENFFKKESPEAVMRIAHVYKRAKENKLREAALREIMNKYPKSRQSRSAHEQLEAMGARIKGGVNVER